MAELDDFELDFAAEFREVDRRLASRTHILKAIRLLIIDGDPISAMTLSCAALDVLEGVSRSRHLATWFDQGARDYGDGVDVARRNVRAQYNFLKHSNRDPDRQLRKLSPDMVMLLIYGAIHDYEQLYESLATEMMIMRMWALARMAALRDEPGHSSLHSKLDTLFREPATASFDDARDPATSFLRWCESEPEEVAEFLFGPPPQKRRCQYRL